MRVIVSHTFAGDRKPALWIKRVAIDPPGGAHVTSARLRSLATASLGLWAVAIVAGRLMAYFK